MTRLQWLYVALAALVTVSYPVLFASDTGWLVQAIIVGSLAQAGYFWFKTNLRYPTPPAKLLPPYLLTGAMLMTHIVEEQTTGFGPAIGELVNSPWDRDGFIASFVVFFPVLWVAGMIGVAYRHPLGGFMAWFLCVGMIFGEWTHVGLFPFLEGGRYSYFPGLWTALLPMIPALWMMVTIWQDARAQQRKAVGEPTAVAGG